MCLKHGERDTQMRVWWWERVCRQHADMAAAHGMEPQGAFPTGGQERSYEELPAAPGAL